MQADSAAGGGSYKVIGEIDYNESNPHVWKPPPGAIPPPPLSSSSSKIRHILIDQSNMFFSARSSDDIANNKMDTLSLRLNITGLTVLLENNQQINTRYVAGTFDGSNYGIWSAYKKARYTCSMIQKNPDRREKDVDSVLHATGLQIAFDHKDKEPGLETLVIATGDGNYHNLLTSFPRLVYAAASMGMRVEIWSWANSRSANFARIAKYFTDGRVTLHDLDPYFDRVTYRVSQLTKTDTATESGGSTGYSAKTYTRVPTGASTVGADGIEESANYKILDKWYKEYNGTSTGINKAIYLKWTDDWDLFKSAISMGLSREPPIPMHSSYSMRDYERHLASKPYPCKIYGPP
jgi:hypothetical protein